jgi:uncharacterized protein with HEPN domain
MKSEVKTWLFDILNAIEEIDFFFADKPKDFNEYRNDLKTKRAVERNMEIIGQAISRILKSEPDFPLSNSRKIVDLRNRIIHGYDSVSDAVIWGILLRHIPMLKREVLEHLDVK